MTGRRKIATGSPASPPPPTRCAIYTRKSTEEGLEQEFNTLDAQREAAEAFIASQKEEGWVALPTHYDDGGYTGGNMDRPALARLLADIQRGYVDCVVVYKVDRLSRSLLDFAKIVEVLNANDVAFVSVTQQFNTAHSIGRLMLHILLSFAQFERETIAERTRDKMSAARRKGKWTGGTPVLGYDVIGGKLVVNEAEAARVRAIFEMYLEEGSLLATARALNAKGWTTKSWITKKGKHRAGARFTKPGLMNLLTNVLYAGKTRLRGEIFPGEHAAIVDDETWRRVQDQLRQNGRGCGGARNKHGALLKGLLYCRPCGTAMSHTYTVKGAKRYRYYVCGRAQKEGWDTCPTKSVPAHEIEAFVVDQIRGIGADEELVGRTIEQARTELARQVEAAKTEEDLVKHEIRTLEAALRRTAETGGNGHRADVLADLHDRMREKQQRLSRVRQETEALSGLEVDEEDLRAALSLFDPVWNALFPREQARVIRLLIERIDYDGADGALGIAFRPTGIRTLAGEVAGARP